MNPKISPISGVIVFALLASSAMGDSAEDALAPRENYVSVPSAATSKEPEAQRFHLTFGADVTNAYFFRGIWQEDNGFILQPYADLTLDLARFENATVLLKAGTWNSFHSESTASATTDDFTEDWYESDLYAGIGLIVGKWSFDARYTFYTSPSGAWSTIEEAAVSLGFDDSDWLGAWSLKPTATLAVETGSKAVDGGKTGTYLQLGISPGFSFDAGRVTGISVSFPVTIGLSLDDYYEGTGGEDDTFGFAAVGTKVSVPLGLNESWGAWTLNAGVQGLFMGDAASTFNKGDEVEVIGTIGVSVTF